MKKSIVLDIPEPCHEDWQQMTPQAQGRHCAKCQTTVVDFTQKTDEQIVKALTAQGPLCGRFKTNQLQRELSITRKEKNSYLSWVASGLFAFLSFGTQEVLAQGNPRIVKYDTVQMPTVKGKKAVSLLNKKTITGNVSTAIDGIPLPGANVIIKGARRGTQTDFYGNFSVEVSVGDILSFSYPGLKTYDLTVDTRSKYYVALEDDCSLEEVVVVAGGLVFESCHPDNSRYPRDDSYIKANPKYLLWLKRNKERRAQWKAERKAKREAIRNGERERTAIGKFFYGIKRLFSKK